MGRRNRLTLLCTATIASLWLAGCRIQPALTPAAVVAPTPAVTLVEGPGQVCRVATQLRLIVNISGADPGDAGGRWEIQSASGQSLHAGNWTLRDGALLIPFPDGQPMVPGSYTMSLRWRDQELARHSFSVAEAAPAISDLGVSLVPGGELGSRFAPDIRLLFVNFAFDGGCPGAPYWITVRDMAGRALCSHSGVLSTPQGAESVACHLGEGEPFAEGSYRAEVTLMNEVTAETEFIIEAEPLAPTPLPTPTATPAAIICEPLFAAAGMAPTGEPFRPLTLFDWYTQAVYVGASCENLRSPTTWESAWYRAGVLVRQERGVWSGAAKGVVWDSLTGQPGNPFLLPGPYTVTLQIDTLAPLWTEFSVYAYEPQSSAE